MYSTGSGGGKVECGQLNLPHAFLCDGWIHLLTAEAIMSCKYLQKTPLGMDPGIKLVGEIYIYFLYNIIRINQNRIKNHMFIYIHYLPIKLLMF